MHLCVRPSDDTRHAVACLANMVIQNNRRSALDPALGARSDCASKKHNGRPVLKPNSGIWFWVKLQSIRTIVDRQCTLFNAACSWLYDFSISKYMFILFLWCNWSLFCLISFSHSFTLSLSMSFYPNRNGHHTHNHDEKAVSATGNSDMDAILSTLSLQPNQKRGFLMSFKLALFETLNT